MVRYAAGTKSHRAINVFSNVATSQRLSPVGYIRPERSAPRSPSFSPSPVLRPRSGAYVLEYKKVRTSARALRLASSCRASLRGKLTCVLIITRRLSISHIRSRYERTGKVSAALKFRNISQEKIFARAFEDCDATAQLICLRLACIELELELEFRI